MLPIRLYELVTDTLIGGGERQADSPVSVVGVSRLGGDVAAMDQPFNAKVATFLGLAASLNLFLFLFNLLPILPLDGGHVAGALYEASRRKLAQWRGRPDPGPVDIARLHAGRLRGRGRPHGHGRRGHLGRPGQADHARLRRGPGSAAIMMQ